MRDLPAIIRVIVLGDLVLASAGLYLLPVLAGWIRRVPNLGSLAAVNMVLGWTVIGWVAALAMALRPADQAGVPARIRQGVSAAPERSCPPEYYGRAGRQALHPRRDGCPPPLKLPPRAPGSSTAIWP